MVTTLDGEVFIADGRRIRKVYTNGTITTVAGTTAGKVQQQYFEKRLEVLGWLSFQKSQ